MVVEMGSLRRIFQGDPAWNAVATGDVSRENAELIFARMQCPGEAGGDGFAGCAVNSGEEGPKTGCLGIQLDSKAARLFERFQGVMGLVESPLEIRMLA